MALIVWRMRNYRTIKHGTRLIGPPYLCRAIKLVYPPVYPQRLTIPTTIDPPPLEDIKFNLITLSNNAYKIDLTSAI